MPSTHLSLHYHIVFGTKNYEPFVQPAWRGDLHAYLGGIIRTADGIAETVGGVSDHVHLLVGLRATHRLADVLRELKAVSSSWVHNVIGAREFAWQEGYGAFTVSASQRETVGRYIEQQREHHRPRKRSGFAKNIWNCYAATAWNSTSVTFNLRRPCWGFMFLLSDPGGFHHRLMSRRPFGSTQ